MISNRIKMVMFGGIAAAMIAAVPTVGMARQHYTAKTKSHSSTVVPMMAITPITHSKKSSAKLVSHKHVAAKTKIHTTTILYKHHHHKITTAVKKHTA